MEITIGIRNVARELTFETEASADSVAKAVAAALDGDARVLDLQDLRGRRIIVPATALGYVEIGAEERRSVGFGTV